MADPVVIIERIRPADEHRRLKFLELRGRVEGSPWQGITKTFNLAKFDGPKGKQRLEKKLQKFTADVLEYYGRDQTEPLVEKYLKELGIKEVPK